MVDRYQQGELASARTPLPTEDHSASQAAMLISQAADRQRDQIMSSAVGHLARAEGKFNQMQGYANQLANSLKATKGTGDEERRRLQVALAHRDENDLAEKTFNDYRKQYADNPDAALAAFEAQIPQMREEFQSRHEADPVAFRMLLPVHDSLERQTKDRLTTWAQKAANSKLEGRLNLLPEEMSASINNLSGSVDEQFEGFQSLLRSADATYMQMYNSAQDDGVRASIKLQNMKLGNALGKDFVNHLVTQMPEGEPGLKYLDNLGNLVQNAHAIGLPLAPSDQNTAMNALRTYRANEERDIVTEVQTEGTLKVLNVSKYKADILEASAANDRKALTKIAQDVKVHYDGLSAQIEKVGQEPDSIVKKAKLLELRKEQTTLISEIGMDLKENRTLDMLARTMESMARAQRGEARALVGFARSSIQFNNYLADREIRKEEKASREAAVAAWDKQIDRFNKEWGGILKNTKEAWALPPGEAQKSALKSIADGAMPILNKAFQAGTISRESYKSYMDHLGTNMQEASKNKVTKPNWIGFGGGQIVNLKGKELEAAQNASKQEFGKIVQKYGNQYDELEKAFGYINTHSLNKREKAVLTQYASEKLPSFFGDSRYQNAHSKQKEQLLSTWVLGKLNQYRKGGLK